MPRRGNKLAGNECGCKVGKDFEINQQSKEVTEITKVQKAQGPRLVQVEIIGIGWQRGLENPRMEELWRAYCVAKVGKGPPHAALWGKTDQAGLSSELMLASSLQAWGQLGHRGRGGHPSIWNPI